MADHDYAACQNELCVRCEAFGDGYRQGKGRRWRYSRHRNPLPHPVKAPCRFCQKCATALSNAAPRPLTAQGREAAAVPRCAKRL